MQDFANKDTGTFWSGGKMVGRVRLERTTNWLKAIGPPRKSAQYIITLRDFTCIFQNLPIRQGPLIYQQIFLRRDT